MHIPEQPLNLSQENVFKTIIIGGGPAGLGSLVLAVKNNNLDALLDSKICIIEKNSSIGAGNIGKYEINSDTPGGGFLECLSGEDGVFENMLDLPETKYISEHADTYVPLKLVGSYMAKLGECLESVVNTHSNSEIVKNTEVLSVHLLNDGVKLIKARTRISDNKYLENEYYAQNIIVATGARQNKESILTKDLAGLGITLGDKYKQKTVISDDILSGDGINQIKKLLKEQKKKIVVLGSFHSAFASLVNIFKKLDMPNFDTGSIKVLYNKIPKIYYLNENEAYEEGYTAFNKNDICPRTNRVFRFGGLRMESRDLLRKILGLHPQDKEERVILIPYPKTASELQVMLNEATVIIAALGYERIEIPFFTEDDVEICLQPYENPSVDENCNLLSRSGDKLPGVFGVGLASGFTPVGGEPSFSGHTNSVWIYQNPAAKKILNQIL